jgi:hypothetical protein
MARTISQIKASMRATKASETALTDLNSTSQTAIYNLWLSILATSQWIIETLWDRFKIELEIVIANAPVMTDKWLHERVLEFQYDSVTPQVVNIIDNVPQYDPIDTTKQIITRASVRTLPNRIVSIKTAKSDPPEQLSAAELSSLSGYVSDLTPAGVYYQALSFDPDLIFISSTIYYNGQYASVISANVIAAIENYLANIPFDGYVRVSALEDAIQAVTGVRDVVFHTVSLRTATQSFGVDNSYLVASNATFFNKYPLFAGYVISETGSNDLASNLTFTAE